MLSGWCAVWVMYCPERIAEGVCCPGGPRGCAVQTDVLSMVELVTIEGAFQRGVLSSEGVLSGGCAVQGRLVLSIT